MTRVTDTVAEVELPGLTPWRRGKVRSIYEAGPQHLVIVASDRWSAYDSELPTPIPGPGAVLTRHSSFWFHKLASADKTLEIYPGQYHELFNEVEPDRTRTIADLVRWLDAHATR